MSDHASASGDTLRIERRLPGPIERVWAYIVDPEKRALWFVGGIWELRAGGVANSVWDHTRLSHEPTPDAWKDFDGMTTTSTITRVDPPRLLTYRGDMGGAAFDVTFELTPADDDVILAIIQSPVSDEGKASFGSGWHAYLDILDDRLHGKTPRAFWTNFNRLQEEYAKRF